MRIAKSREVAFFAEADAIPDIVTTIDEQVLPRFAALPHFLGFVALKSESGPRAEVVGLSFWASGLEDSEAVSEEFRDEVHRVTGTTPSRKSYDVLRVMVYDSEGEICVDLP
ncbi:MAG: hypothetical protein ABSG81_01835 [Acidimicrobiales bacterium]|jgi:hypothetical protein